MIKSIIKRIIKMLKRYYERIRENYEYYMAFIIILLIIVFIVNKIIVVWFDIPNNKINFIDTVITVLFIDFLIDVFKRKEIANKLERCDWAIYDLAIEYFTILEIIFLELGNIEYISKNNLRYYREKLKDELKNIDWNQEVELKTKLGVNYKYSKKELFIIGLKDIESSLEKIMDKYYFNIDDKIFSQLHQIRRNIGLYKFNKKHDFSKFDIEEFSFFIYEQSRIFSKLQKNWYYRQRNWKEEYEKNNDVRYKPKCSLRRLRTLEGYIIEEFVFLKSGVRDEGEILYRFIEAGELKITEKECKAIIKVLGKDKYDINSLFECCN